MSDECYICGVIPKTLVEFSIKKDVNIVNVSCDCANGKVETPPNADSLALKDAQMEAERKRKDEAAKNKNPDSETETGVSDEDIWDLVVRLLKNAYVKGHNDGKLGEYPLGDLSDIYQYFQEKLALGIKDLSSPQTDTESPLHPSSARAAHGIPDPKEDSSEFAKRQIDS